jgi:parvulin-like peptidyl-prolyl isomerase
LVAVSLVACSGSGSDPNEPVAQVGDRAITRAELAHWVSVLKGGATASGPNRRPQQALSLLISYQWLIGEAASRSISISELEVRQQVDRILMRTFPGSIAELREFLKPIGETVTDIKLQARAQLALAKLRKTILAGVPAVTDRQIATYYDHHKRSFLILERREARFANWKTKAAALKKKREVQAGKSLTSPAAVKVGEVYAGARVPPSNVYERAIDSIKPYKISGPFHIGNDYWLYQVVKIIPARQQTLRQVAGSIARQLTGQHRHEAEAAFVKSWTAAWSARTDCQTGYVVHGCRQYRGATTDGEELPEV